MQALVLLPPGARQAKPSSIQFKYLIVHGQILNYALGWALGDSWVLCHSLLAHAMFDYFRSIAFECIVLVR